MGIINTPCPAAKPGRKGKIMKKYTYQQLLDIIEKKGRYSQCVPLVEIMLRIEHETGKVQGWGDTAPDWVAKLFACGEKSFI